MRRLLTILVVLAAGGVALAAEPFRHPGILHTREDLERMKAKVAGGVEPWRSGFDALRSHKHSQSDYALRGPYRVVVRGPGENVGKDDMEADVNAAYQNALMWAITGDEAYAKKSVQILNAWSSTLTEMKGRDVQLSAGLYGFKLVNAAEIMRHTYPKWPAQDVERCGKMFRDVFYPPARDFATFANGNWDGACMKMMIAVGVFCDDRAMFDRAVGYFRDGAGNGRLTHYVVDEAGQCQESGRDQQHTQLGLGLLAEVCEIAWNQGVDLYGAADNRLLKGFEYTAKYNLGEDVPFTPFADATGKYVHDHIAPNGRGKLRPVYEMVWNHYHNRKGLDTPYTERAAAKLRPEGAAFQADHPGFGTLLFTRPHEPVGAAVP
jgi:hypothetical protein